MLFFFDTDDGRRRMEDHSGTDLPDEAEAVEQAVALLRDLSHVPAVPGVPQSFSVQVRGPAGEDLYTATLQLAVERSGRG